MNLSIKSSDVVREGKSSGCTVVRMSLKSLPKWGYFGNCCSCYTSMMLGSALTLTYREVLCDTDTKIRIDSVMRPRSSSRGHNASASVTVKSCVSVCCCGVGVNSKHQATCTHCVFVVWSALLIIMKGSHFFSLLLS